MAPDTYQPALVTVGDYDLVAKIADGGMGTVYKGRHRTTGEMVAVKLLAPHMANNPTYLQRFEKEYTAARLLAHPNVVRSLEHGFADGRPYLVMEFVDGESVGQRLERTGRMPEAEALRIISLAAQGLEQAHTRGLVHRDVKPDNIMLTHDGQVKIADLGLVKDVDGDLNLTRTGRGLGTPHFMAPEQFRNAKNADVRCDVYSLGATLYMMVTGHMPFAACPPLEAFLRKQKNELAPARKLVPEVSERTSWAIRRAMDPSPEQRPASCREFLDDLTGPGTRQIPIGGGDTAQEPWWYLQYADDQGKPHLVKGRISGIRRSVREGRLGNPHKVLVCPTKAGAYGPLRSFPEFRDLVAETPTSRPDTPLNLPTATDANLGELEKTSEPVARSKSRAPHIPLEADASHTWEWVTLILFFGFAVAAGVVMAFLVPH